MEVPVIRVGISSCLLGQKVRFDGGHKLDTLLTETLGRHFAWVPVCPEMEIGLGAPRETMHLVEGSDGTRLVTVKTNRDLTGTMSDWACRRIGEVAGLKLSGYILKKDSPSCGMERVRVYDPAGAVRRSGQGIFAGMLLQAFPMLPVEEEGRLHDANLRENFVERVFAHHRWREFREIRPVPADLIGFHARHKLTLSSHSDSHYRKLGRIVAGSGKGKMPGILDEYGRLFMEALRVRATPRKHANVLYHILGFLKHVMDAADKAELIVVIEEYRNERVPLVVPLTLLKHHLRHHPVPWIEEQTYLHPYPAELMLRNHV
jgi:uncharacterized protein YbgA (DUF1722 family)/uncharacterized protein YbbK (DUF523 family)